MIYEIGKSNYCGIRNFKAISNFQQGLFTLWTAYLSAHILLIASKKTVFRKGVTQKPYLTNMIENYFKYE